MNPESKSKKKTEFAQLWSKIMHSDTYERDHIIFYFEDREGLLQLHPHQIHAKRGRNFTIDKVVEYDRGKLSEEWVEIPENNIWVVTYKDEIIFDRREFYQGKKELLLPTENLI